MLTLSLLRHAKSNWDDPALADHDRPLAKRGTKAAPEIAKYLKREELLPNLVLCSGAVRTRATLALILAEIGRAAPEIRYDDTLYLADPETVLQRIKDVEPVHAHVMVIGHNPGLHALALELTGGGERKAVAALATEFPTAALAVLTFDATRWSDIKTASGRLEHFVTPRRLAA
jgi:phosphohistidine phosphatase